MMTHVVRLNVLVSLVGLLLSGCMGVMHVKVAHDPLAAPPQEREGIILLRQFVDERMVDRRYIGIRRGGYFNPLDHVAVKGDASLESLLTDYFSAALGAAGYHVIREQPGSSRGSAPALQVDGIVEGDIIRFRDGIYGFGERSLAEVVIHVQLRDRNGQNVLWEKQISGASRGWESTTWGFDPHEGYERAIRKALDRTLAQAVEAFSSDEFYGEVEKQRGP
jgi:hypothetical protein